MVNTREKWAVSLEIAQKLIAEQFPQLSNLTVEKIGVGYDNMVYKVGEQYVFRFPRRDSAIQPQRMEGKILNRLAPLLPIAIPKPVLYGVESTRYPVPFLGYTYIQGAFPKQLSDERRGCSYHILASFIRKLHSFSVEEALQASVPYNRRNHSDMMERKKFLIEALSKVAAYIKEEDFKKIAAYVHAVEVLPIPLKETLVHSDLHFMNLLVDYNGIVTGILDWSDLDIGHPAADLEVAYSFLPASFRDAFFQAYGPVDEETKYLARFLAVYKMMLLLTEAVEQSDNEEIKNEICLSLLRAISD